MNNKQAEQIRKEMEANGFRVELAFEDSSNGRSWVIFATDVRSGTQIRIDTPDQWKDRKEAAEAGV